MNKLILTRTVADEVEDVLALDLPSSVPVHLIAGETRSGVHEVPFDVASQIAELVFADISDMEDVRCWLST